MASNVVIGILFLAVRLAGMSIQSIGLNEYGLFYSFYSKTVSQTPSLSGYYLVLPGNSFIVFPRSVQTIEFSFDTEADRGFIESRTSDGLEVLLEISFQYQLIPEHLYDLYMKYELHYKKTLLTLAVDSLTDMATKYTAYDFFMNRGGIGNEMEQALNEVLRRQVYCAVVFFQLRDVDLPDAFEDAIQLTEVKKQEIHKAEARTKKTKVQIQTDLITAELQVQTIRSKAEAEGQALLAATEAKLQGYIATESQHVSGLKALAARLELTSAELLQLMQSKALEGHQADKLVLALA